LVASVADRQSVQLRGEQTWVNGQTISRTSQKRIRPTTWGDRFDPVGATAQREVQQKAALKLRNEQQQLDAEIAAIVKKHNPVA
jgi:hypothetical protein